ncbi:MAG: hypothetical protein ACRCZZ_07160 [Phocaeicola sp.]
MKQFKLYRFAALDSSGNTLGYFEVYDRVKPYKDEVSDMMVNRFPAAVKYKSVKN